MDHLRLAWINDRNAAVASRAGNRKMEQAYRNLANYHRAQHQNQQKGVD